MSDFRFGSWSAAESPVAIEYSLVVIEEIRHEVSEGFQKLSRGGVEVGGLLYGAREGRTIRILSMRPIACEHARGPAFLLSDKDAELLHNQLSREAEDTRLEGMICLGWFVSHTRSEIVLAESDSEIYEKYFDSPWQVTLVIRPGRGGSMRAGFFVREQDGTVRSASSYLEFNFPDRLAGVLDRPRSERRAGERRQSGYSRESSPPLARPEFAEPEAPGPVSVTVSTPVQVPFSGPQLLPTPPPKAKWPWLVAWGLAVVTLVIVVLRFYVLAPKPDPLALSLSEHDGQLQIEWNHTARPVTSAVRGELLIHDGRATRTFPLTPLDLEHGFAYKRTSEDVEVHMSVENAGGTKVEETTTFLGAAPAKPDAPAPVASSKETVDVQGEVDRLKRENAGQAARIQELERDLKILQSRLGGQ